MCQWGFVVATWLLLFPTGDYTSAAQHIPAVIAAEEAITALSAGRYVFPNVLGSMQEVMRWSK